MGACNGGDVVNVSELLTMVNIALGTTPVSTCRAGDANGDGRITIDELLAAVSNALNGCGVFLPTPTPTFTGKLGLGAMCTSAAQCQSGFCTDSLCCNTSACPVGKVCGSSGVCVVSPPPTATPPPTSTPTATPQPQPTGRLCTSGSQCVSGNCVDSVCCALPFCPSGMACNVSGKEGQCVVIPTATPTVPQPIGAPCATDGQCLSSHCTDGACCVVAQCQSGQLCNISGHAGNCFSPPTPTPLPNGFSCSSPSQCTSGFCTDGVCCNTRTCPNGQACNVSGKVGQCAVAPTPTKTPIPTPTAIPLGAPCDPGNPGACVSGFCTNNVCCNTEFCAGNQRCDIFLFEGTCSDQLNVDEPCDKGTDCTPPLVCLPDSALDGNDGCVPVPTFTPTLIPLSTVTPSAGVHILIGTARGGPGDAVAVSVSLITSGASVAATVNDITFNTDVLSLDPSTCRVNTTIGKSLTAGALGAGTVRVFVQPANNNTSPIPDGPLYTCTFQIAPLALPGVYPLTNGNALAFSPSGTQFPSQSGGNGSITVSLIPLACVGDC